MLPYLHFDIHVNIIKKLPIKSLLQFRSVCKAWKSLIDSSRFIAGYSDRHDLPQHLFVRYEVKHGEEIEVKYVCFVDDDTFPQQKFALTVPPLVQATTKSFLLGSSHGLLFLTDDFGFGHDPTSVIIWNPAIRKSIVVALPKPVHNMIHIDVGFGVRPDTKDPTLVAVTEFRHVRGTILVFTLSSGEWRCIRSSHLPRKSITFTCYQTVVGQCMYWIATDWIATDGGFRSRDLIISFDMSTEEFREIDLPDGMAEPPPEDDLILSISRLRESLVVLENNFGDSGKQVCAVWMMMEHGDSKTFTKLYTISLPNGSVLQTPGFTKSGEPINEMCDDIKVFESPSALVVYEPYSEHIKNLGIVGNRCSFDVSSHTESLILLDHDDGHIYEEVFYIG